MIASDEDALICDFAETYHIYDFRQLPLEYAATLACGLRDDSRIKQKLSGQGVSTASLINAAAVDALNLLVWFKTKDSKRNRNRPKSLVTLFTQKEKEGIRSFESVEDFERTRQEILKRS